MKNRKRGFSLVELLIVLAVIAALIATITPVALNAIRKSQATKVVQNMKTLASSFENYVYVNGEAPADLSDVGRDIDPEKYGIVYDQSSVGGAYTVTILTIDPADSEAVEAISKDLTSGSYTISEAYTGLNSLTESDVTFYYNYTFVNY